MLSCNKEHNELDLSHQRTAIYNDPALEVTKVSLFTGGAPRPRSQCDPPVIPRDLPQSQMGFPGPEVSVVLQ